MPASLRACALVLGAATIGCGASGGAAPARACADTVTVVTPANTTIVVGQSFIAKAEVFTCATTQRIEDSFSWSTRNGDVAVIHEQTKIVVGTGPGTTYIDVSPFHNPHAGMMMVTVH